MPMPYAKVRLLDAPLQVDREYDYRVTAEWAGQIVSGSLVVVPFGYRNYRRQGLVVALAETSDYPHVKNIVSPADPPTVLSEEMLGLVDFLRERTFCTTGDAVRAMMPPKMLGGSELCYRPTDRPVADAGRLPEPLLDVYVYLRQSGQSTHAALHERFGAAVDGVLEKLCRRRLVEKEKVLKTGRGVRRDVVLRLTDLKPSGRLGERQKALLELLAGGERTGAQLRAAGFTKAHFNALLKKGWVEAETIEVRPNAFRPDTVFGAALPADFVLNEEQQKAFDTMCGLMADGKPHAVLLYGVTGSGKTPVMLKTIDETLTRGRGVIVLLPEIALTPQTLSIFSSRYGNRVAVMHSGLSAAERLDAYYRVLRGEADIVVGTRSAVFAPVQNLGLIVMDEEQENTYKSDQNPKYHARDVARYRTAANNALLLLCSATPSLESYKKAKEGRYTLLTLKHRHAGAALPRVVVADMRLESGEGALSPLGGELTKSLHATMQAGEQAVLFLNRRGYHHAVVCRSCGEALTCPNCSVSLTYHTKDKDYQNGYLMCHFCGRRLPLPDKCPKCGSTHLGHMGFGTQRVEQELARLLPDKTVLRMDTDTTASRTSYDEMLGRFRRHGADVLLGTQMVTKGHDFPDVTLVGVLMADASLYLDDYRAAERTFSLLTQVIGRSGRAEKPGVAVIQTQNPDHEVIRLACRQDYDAFYEREIRLRRSLVFPPFCDIVLLTLSHSEEARLMTAALRLKSVVESLMKTEFAGVGMILYGPFQEPVYRAEGRYRMRLVAKCALDKKTRALFARVVALYTTEDTRGPLLSVDPNPSNL